MIFFCNCCCTLARRSVSQSAPNSSGITKRRLTGNQRKKLRLEQASKLGISADKLLQQRRSKMEEWQRVRFSLRRVRCPNCGIWGHSFKWCPFAGDAPMQPNSVSRFHGSNGSWGAERTLEMTPQQILRYNQYFSLLSMPLQSTDSSARGVPPPRDGSSAQLAQPLFLNPSLGGGTPCGRPRNYLMAAHYTRTPRPTNVNSPNRRGLHPHHLPLPV